MQLYALMTQDGLVQIQLMTEIEYSRAGQQAGSVTAGQCWWQPVEDCPLADVEAALMDYDRTVDDFLMGTGRW